MSFCNEFDISEKWNLNESKIAILPLGAQEQHGMHLPLNTDTIQAVFFAEQLAINLDAMLLPAMPYGTSMEHHGFRGTISLTPDLLMHFIRVMADELELQNVKYFVIVNGHGGNFAMGPAVRAINKEDRKIKILIANFYQFTSSKTEQPEIHSGEGETSLLMAIEKKLVKENRIDENPSLEEKPFLQSDLNHFGVGRMSKSGVWGQPSKASVAKGQKMIKEIHVNLLAFVQDRINRWEEDRRYGGPGRVSIRPLTKDDVALGMRLKNAAKWNQLENDWDMLLTASKGGSFVAIHNGLPCGTATTVTYEKKFSWIGMVLVDPTIRRAGVGSKLLTEAIAFAKANGTVRLDATPDGKKLYDTLGFKDEYTLSRMECFKYNAETANDKQIKKISAADLKKITVYDTTIFGANRATIINHLFKQKNNYAFIKCIGKKVIGYCLGRPGQNFEQIGPILADDTQTAIQLTSTALSNCKGKDIIIDILDNQMDFLKQIEEWGFTKQRPFIRMYLGTHKNKGNPKKQYAITGPELG